MALTLKQLVQIVPIDEEVKQKVLTQEATLTESQKFEITQICWRLLSVLIDSKRQEKFDEMIKETAEGGIEYQPEDFDRAEDEVISEFLIKMDQLQTEENITDVKNQMKEYASSQSAAPTQTPPVPQVN